MSISAPSLSTLLTAQDFFVALQHAATKLSDRYEVFLVDHGRASHSTHRFWWNHFEDACRMLGVPCTRLSKESAKWPMHRRAAKRGIYLFFTMQSLYRDRLRWFRAVQRGAIQSTDIVASWDPRVLEEFHRSRSFQIGFPSEGWLAAHAVPDRNRVVIWRPYAPLTAVARGMTAAAHGQSVWDFAYFGTLNPHNYDTFRTILRPLARRHRCRYAGKVWRVYAPAPLRYGFSPFLIEEERGLDILLDSKINLALHNDYHRRAQSLTERLFISAALGRPVVCDNAGACQYFSPQEVPVGEDPKTFLSVCEAVLSDLPTRLEIARDVQKKTLTHYTYLQTVLGLLTEIDSKVAEGA